MVAVAILTPLTSRERTDISREVISLAEQHDFADFAVWAFKAEAASRIISGAHTYGPEAGGTIAPVVYWAARCIGSVIATGPHGDNRTAVLGPIPPKYANLYPALNFKQSELDSPQLAIEAYGKTTYYRGYGRHAVPISSSHQPVTIEINPKSLKR